MNTSTITSVAKRINNYIADLSERVTRFDHEIAPEYDTLGGDRYCVKVYEVYNKVEIIHEGECSEWFGATRAKLFRQGRVNINRFFGNDGRRISLDLLRKRERLSKAAIGR